jgi:hypothetical protein
MFCGSLMFVRNDTVTKIEARTWQTKQGIRLRGHADADQAVLWLVVDLGLPVIHFILFWYRQVALNAALRIKELDLGPGLDEAVGYL